MTHLPHPLAPALQHALQQKHARSPLLGTAVRSALVTVGAVLFSACGRESPEQPALDAGESARVGATAISATSALQPVDAGESAAAAFLAARGYETAA